MEPLTIGLIALAVLAAAGVLWLLLTRPGRPTAGEAPAAESDFEHSLSSTSRSFAGRIGAALTRSGIGADLYRAVEEALTATDVGPALATEIVASVKAREPKDRADLKDALRVELLARLSQEARSIRLGRRPAVVVVVGVNGSGKTTTVAKLARWVQGQGMDPIVGGTDTFRAAADEQLRAWSQELGFELVAGRDRADPASVAYDAYQAGVARDKDVVLVDTAGRLHSKHNLMEELAKIVRVLDREANGVDEVLLVIDATTGQNGLVQAREFAGAAGVTGVVLTKVDGTARGGVVLAVESEFGLPVTFMGVGERADDLVLFDPEEFVDVLLADV